MLMMLLQCRPISYFWTRTALDPSYQGHCISIDTIISMTYVYSALAAFCDFTVGILPFFLVRKLNMRKETRLAVMGILSMACVYVPSERYYHIMSLMLTMFDVFSASLAVIVRMPFVKTFKNPDFLCKSLPLYALPLSLN